VNEQKTDAELHAAQRRAATRTAAILGVVALVIYAWVFLARIVGR
jgi:hypothetical protein